MKNSHDSRVFIVGGITYPPRLPFSASRAYPEAPYNEATPESPNPVYGGLRSLFYRAGLDSTHFDTPCWNPLGEFIRPGDKVLIKPNFVKHRYLPEVDIECLVTHPSLIRAVLDYVVIALKGKGRITVGDAPVQSADFGSLVEENGTAEVVRHVSQSSGMEVGLRDFRAAEREMLGNLPVGLKKREVERTAVSLDERSAHFDLKGMGRFCVTDYPPSTLQEHHNTKRHEYLIAGEILAADVVINIPKLKSHRKAGMTCCLKNAMGINVSKDWLPHHRRGSILSGGDEYLYPSLFKALRSSLLALRETSSNLTAKRLWQGLARMAKRMDRFNPGRRDPFTEGSWYGNDTLWRTILDINRVLFYADKDGVIRDEPQRRIIYVVDGVTIGEGEGPLNPTPRHLGVLMLGRNPVAVDACASGLIGFDPCKIPAIDKAFSTGDPPLAGFGKEDIEAIFGEKTVRPYLDLRQMVLTRARPPDSWAGHIELR
ncbi:MAG: DUF362 domain-containing protein [Deltaproteobacteria bacterium]|nr:DUF362 domain-containing protein [Deltaproteobacteria bacterium]